MSSLEVEYIAASDVAIEAIWIRNFIVGIGFVPTIKEPMEMICDNTSAIILANETGAQKGAKHCRRKVHYLWEVIEKGYIKLLKFHSDDNIVDMFTKALPLTKHIEHASSIGLRRAKSLM